MMWRARTGDGDRDLLILLEFQARPDRFMALGLDRERAPQEMRPQLRALRCATKACDDEDFDRFMGGCVRAMLVSRGFSGEQLEEAMTMGSVITAFERGLEEMDLGGLGDPASAVHGPPRKRDLPG